MIHIPIVIIAAGRGQRFGSYPKILFKINKKPILHHILDAALQSSREKIFLVLGYKYKIVKQFCLSYLKNHKSLKILYNKNWQKGKSSSIKTAIKNIPKNSKGIIILLGDMPYITSEMIRRSKKEFIKHGSKKIIYWGNTENIGHPVIFPKEYFPSLLKLRSNNGGMHIIKKHRGNTISIGKFHKKVQQDIDVPEDIT